MAVNEYYYGTIVPHICDKVDSSYNYSTPDTFLLAHSSCTLYALLATGGCAVDPYANCTGSHYEKRAGACIHRYHSIPLYY